MAALIAAGVGSAVLGAGATLGATWLASSSNRESVKMSNDLAVSLVDKQMEHADAAMNEAGLPKASLYTGSPYAKYYHLGGNNFIRAANVPNVPQNTITSSGIYQTLPLPLQYGLSPSAVAKRDKASQAEKEHQSITRNML